MAIWLEIRCERRGDGRPSWHNPCWSDDNNGPGELSNENQRDVQATLQMLNKECLTAGWKKIRGEGWVCPECLDFEAAGGSVSDE